MKHFVKKVANLINLIKLRKKLFVNVNLKIIWILLKMLLLITIKKIVNLKKK